MLVRSLKLRKLFRNGGFIGLFIRINNSFDLGKLCLAALKELLRLGLGCLKGCFGLLGKCIQLGLDVFGDFLILRLQLLKLRSDRRAKLLGIILDGSFDFGKRCLAVLKELLSLRPGSLDGFLHLFRKLFKRCFRGLGELRELCLQLLKLFSRGSLILFRILFDSGLNLRKRRTAVFKELLRLFASRFKGFLYLLRKLVKLGADGFHKLLELSPQLLDLRADGLAVLRGKIRDRSFKLVDFYAAALKKIVHLLLSFLNGCQQIFRKLFGIDLQGIQDVLIFFLQLLDGRLDRILAVFDISIDGVADIRKLRSAARDQLIHLILGGFKLFLKRLGKRVKLRVHGFLILFKLVLKLIELWLDRGHVLLDIIRDSGVDLGKLCLAVLKKLLRLGLGCLKGGLSLFRKIHKLVFRVLGEYRIISLQLFKLLRGSGLEGFHVLLDSRFDLRKLRSSVLKKLFGFGLRCSDRGLGLLGKEVDRLIHRGLGLLILLIQRFELGIHIGFGIFLNGCLNLVKLCLSVGKEGFRHRSGRLKLLLSSLGEFRSFFLHRFNELLILCIERLKPFLQGTGHTLFLYLTVSFLGVYRALRYGQRSENQAYAGKDNPDLFGDLPPNLF